MTARLRMRVEVTPRLSPIPAVPAPVDAGSSSARGPVPRLTELADAVDLSGAELDEELASVRRQRSTLAAYEAGLVERKATLGAVHVLPYLPGSRTDVRAPAAADELRPDPSLQAAEDFLADEVAVLLNMSVPSTRYLVERDLVLVRQLPEVWHALADQRIDETRAHVIVKALGWQGASHGGPIADGTIADLAALGVGWAARGCPPTTLRERLDAALIAADPAAADRRKELRKRAADVTVTWTGDGLADLRAAQMDTADARLARAQIDAYAQRLKADGDTRPIGAIRVAVLAALIARPWEKREPGVVDVTINADLADLGCPCNLTSADAGPGAGAAASDATSDKGARGDVAGRAHTGGEGPAASNPDDSTGDDVTGYHATRHDATRHDATGDGAEGGRGAVEAPGDALTEDFGTPDPGDAAGYPRLCAGTRVGHVDGLPVPPSAVRALMERIDVLGLVPPVGGSLAVTLTDGHGHLLAVATPDEIAAALRAGRGLGPPRPASGYTPTSAQYRYLRARDRHCRFPGCRQSARASDADHVIPYDHTDPRRGGPTCVTNLVLLCRHHHRLKTHAPDWDFRLEDGALYVTTPGGTTRTTRPPGADQVLDLAAEPPPHDPVADPPPF